MALMRIYRAFSGCTGIERDEAFLLKIRSFDACPIPLFYDCTRAVAVLVLLTTAIIVMTFCCDVAYSSV